VADPHGPPDETLRRAYEMHVAGRSQREIGDELGVAQSTACSYIKKGRAAFLLHAAIEQQEHHEDSALRLHSWVGRLEAAWDQAESVAEKCMLARELRAMEQRRATLLGLDAAAKLQIETRTARDEEKLSKTATFAALQKYMQRNLADEEALNAGRPGVIDGSGEHAG